MCGSSYRFYTIYVKLTLLMLLLLTKNYYSSNIGSNWLVRDYFLAVKDNGELAVWGFSTCTINHYSGTDCIGRAQRTQGDSYASAGGIKEVLSNNKHYFVFTNDNSIKGMASASNVKSIVMTNNYYAILYLNGAISIDPSWKYTLRPGQSAIKPFTTVLGWNGNSYIYEATPPPSNVHNIYSNGYNVAALLKSGSVIFAFNSQPARFSNVARVIPLQIISWNEYSTLNMDAINDRSFMLVQKNGTAVCDNDRYCGGPKGPDRSKLYDVKWAVVVTDLCIPGIAVLRNDGEVLWDYKTGGNGGRSTCHDIYYDQSDDRIHPSAFINIRTMYTTLYYGVSGVWATHSNDDTLYPITPSTYGSVYGTSRVYSESNRILDVKMVASNKGLMTAITHGGKVYIFGLYSSNDYRKGVYPSPSIDSGCVEVVGSDLMMGFACLMEDTTVRVWPWYNNYDYSPPTGLTGAVKIYANGYDYAVMKADSTLVTWGRDSYDQNVNPSTIGKVKQLYSNTLYRSEARFPTVYELQDGVEPFPTSQPTSAPTAQPSSAPTMQPSSAPTGKPSSQPSSTPSAQPTETPTGQPSTQPTSYPSSQPTCAPSSSPTLTYDSIKTWNHHASLDTPALEAGSGFHYHTSHLFSSLGQYSEHYYLSLFVWDSGFGPVEKGQYITFKVNGHDVLTEVGGRSDNNSDGKRKRESRLMCAPIGNGLGSKGCTYQFIPCVMNYDVTEILSTKLGGSLEVEAQSHGVIASSCPHMTAGNGNASTVFVRFNLTMGWPQDTSVPTSEPTQLPTAFTGSVQNINGLQLNINKLDVWKLLQIAAAVGVLLAAAGVFLAKLREKCPEVYQHPLPYAASSLGMLGLEITSLVFLLLKMYLNGYSTSGSVLLAFRFIKFMVAVVCLVGVYASHLFPLQSLRNALNLEPYLHHDHMVAESKVYTVIACLCLVDLTFVVFLPWRDCRFAKLSKGFPNILVFRVVQSFILLASLVSFLIQIVYLNDVAFTIQNDLMFLVNLVLLSAKLFLISIEFAYKLSILTTTSTYIMEQEEKNSKGAKPDKDKDRGQSDMKSTGDTDIEMPTLKVDKTDDDEDFSSLSSHYCDSLLAEEHIEMTSNPLHAAGSTRHAAGSTRRLSSRLHGAAAKADETATLLLPRMQERMAAMEKTISHLHQELPKMVAAALQSNSQGANGGADAGSSEENAPLVSMNMLVSDEDEE